MDYQNMLLQQDLSMNFRTIWMIFFLNNFLIIEHCIDKVLQALPSFNNNNNKNISRASSHSTWKELWVFPRDFPFTDYFIVKELPALLRGFK